MRHITIDNTARRDFHQFMLGAITPRPIALVSTLDQSGLRNLAPYSYFNAVSSIPPILMVSVGRKQDGSKKDTLVNVENTGEFVVNMVSFDLIMQMALSSVQLPPEADEFDLSGLNTLDSKTIKPFRVKESPIHFECKVRDIVELGTNAGESSLILGDVQCIHVDERIIDSNNRIDPAILNIVGRLGRSHYTRVEGSSIETLVLPQLEIPLGFDKLPDHLKESKVLSANELGIMASCTKKPDKSQVDKMKQKIKMSTQDLSFEEVHLQISKAIQEDDKYKALLIACSYDKDQ